MFPSRSSSVESSPAPVPQASSSIPVPSEDLLRQLIHPKTTPVLIPERFEGFTITVAFAEVCLITHIGVLVPCATQEAVFASALTMTVVVGEYIGKNFPRVVFQQTAVPLSVSYSGGSPGSPPSLVLFPMTQKARMWRRQHCGLLKHSTFENTAPVLGRFVKVTLRGSGKIPMMASPILIFGRRIKTLTTDELKEMPLAEFTTDIGPSVFHDAQALSMPISEEQAFQYLFKESYQTFRPEKSHQFEVPIQLKSRVLDALTGGDPGARSPHQSLYVSRVESEVGTSLDAVASEELYHREIATILPAQGTVVNLTMGSTATCDNIRLRHGISRQIRDRYLSHFKVPIWAMDPSSYVFPAPFCLHRDDTKRCNLCGAKIGWLSKHVRCQRCFHVVCQKCTSPVLASIVEQGIHRKEAKVCSSCAADLSTVDRILGEWVGWQAGATTSAHQQFLSLRESFASDTSCTAESEELILLPPYSVEMVQRSIRNQQVLQKHCGDPYELTLPNACAVVSSTSLEGLKSLLRRGRNRKIAFKDAELLFFERVVGKTATKPWCPIVFDDSGNFLTSQLSPISSHVVLLLTGAARLAHLELVYRLPLHDVAGVSPSGARVGSRQQNLSDGSSVTVEILTANSIENFEAIYTANLTAAQHSTRFAAPLTEGLRSGAGGERADEQLCLKHLVMIRFSGLTHDVRALEVYRFSLFGWYGLGAAAMSAECSGSFHRLPADLTANHRTYANHLIAHHALAASRRSSTVSYGSGQLSSGAPVQLPRALSQGRLIPLKSSMLLPTCQSITAFEYEFSAPVTVNGVIVESTSVMHLRSLGGSSRRTPSALRFVGINADGRFSNIGFIALPQALLVSETEAPGMAFAFPSSAHNLSAVQVIVAEWYDENAVPRSSGAASTGQFSEAPLPMKLSFWSSPNAHTRRIISSGVYFSPFSGICQRQ
jgi:hypothetical protein